MLTKFETKSKTVIGLSFHIQRPWILASLSSGVIQLWDYIIGTIVDIFEGHKGPVRGVHFHKSEPLFVSGGDDYKIKVWNYNLRRCVFTLLGHNGYIRTVQFHHDSPWIVSASDDHTIRIWNWRSRSCISVVAGHYCSVMSASFHPKENLLLSASLDKTIRVWDISALNSSQSSSDAAVVVKYVLEGHDGGVNWAHFHPYCVRCPEIVSASDDHQLKFWKFNDDTKEWNVQTLRGHMDDVSCVVFHANHEVIVSTSLDKSIRVWNTRSTKVTEIQTFPRERDRFWILAAHPKINLLAAGHDNGMVVFKLERERPAFAVTGDSLLYNQSRSGLYLDKLSTGRWKYMLPLERSPKILSYNPTQHAVLLCWDDVDGGSYELHCLPEEGYVKGELLDPKRGVGGSAVFVDPNTFAVLDKCNNQVLLKNMKNELVNNIALPIPADAIFHAGTHILICRSDDKVFLFDLQKSIVLGELHTPLTKYVVWSNEMESVALLSKHAIIIADKKLVHQCTLHEKFNVKSGAWDDNGVFIYTTLNRIKYCLPNGESGIIATLEVPIYIAKVTKNIIFFLDRDGMSRAESIDATEYNFKLSLLNKRYDHVMNMIKNSELCGQALTAYLQQKGFPEIALHFVNDERIRFNLALEIGNIQIAAASAKAINEKDQWHRLGVEALRKGNAAIVEFAYQRTKNLEKLSFLYLITGNMEKLSKMLKIAEIKNDVMGQFHNALYMGDVRERVKILENVGHLPLAYITASVHGMHDVAERLEVELGGNVPSLTEGKVPSLLMPPLPVMCGGDWPLLRVMKGIFDDVLYEEYEAAEADWGEELDMVDVDDFML